jgi:hypothetical protein
MPRSKSTGGSRRKKPAKKPIEQYEHTRDDQKRLNNPPVGLVKPENDPDTRPKTYQYDPHLDPQLVWASPSPPRTRRCARRSTSTSMPTAGATGWWPVIRCW